jgi:hypothetical protein
MFVYVPRRHTRDSLPPISPPSRSETVEPIAIDVDAVLQTVKELLRRQR